MRYIPRFQCLPPEVRGLIPTTYMGYADNPALDIIIYSIHRELALCSSGEVGSEAHKLRELLTTLKHYNHTLREEN